MTDQIGELFDDAQFEVPCQNCGAKNTEMLGRLKNDPKITCAACGKPFEVNAKQLRDGFREANEAVEELRRKLGKIS
jgi:transcription elongation factor Elf1